MARPVERSPGGFHDPESYEREGEQENRANQWIEPSAQPKGRAHRATPCQDHQERDGRVEGNLSHQRHLSCPSWEIPFLTAPVVLGGAECWPSLRHRFVGS